MALSVTDTPPPATLPAASATRGESQLQLRLVISIPAVLILVTLIYGLVSYLSFSLFWDDLERAGAGEIARRLLRIHMETLIFLAAAATAAGLVLSTTILRPIRALLEATRNIAHGRLDQHAPRIPSAPELDDLSTSFNAMVDNINLSITQRNRRLMEGLPIGVMSTDITGRISAASPLACQILGLSEQRLLGMRLGELEGVAPQPSHILVEFLLSQIHADATRASAEVTMNDAGGEKTLTVSSTTLKSDEGRAYGYMFSFREVARRRDLSAQLSRADQLAALGTFTLGLAHELRNPLGAIKGFSQLILMERDLPRRTADFLGRMVLEVDRVDGLVRQLFDLSEQPLACRVPTRLDQALAHALEAARLESGPERVAAVTLQLDLHPLTPLLLEQERLVQAFTLLIQNAYDFTPAGGTITLRTSTCERAVLPAWRVEVRNTGSEILPEHHKAIFEPFFTTRDKATGLGLTIANQIIAQNGGHLDAAMDGAETVFTATFENARPADPFTAAAMEGVEP